MLQPSRYFSIHEHDHVVFGANHVAVVDDGGVPS